MITQFRRYTDSWIARGFFIIMAISFVGWGISSDLGRIVGPPTWVAKVGSQTIEIPAFQAEFQRAVAQATRDLPPGQEAGADVKQQVARETLERMISQAAIGRELADLHVVTPDDAVAAAARAMPAFKGNDGQFSKAVFDSTLRNNGFTEARFLGLLRGDVAQRQLLSAVTAGVAAPGAEITPLYDAEFEKRSADMAFFPLAAVPEPTPSAAELQRWYDNHPDSYTTPEYRHVKAIELSPQSLESEITVSDEELQAAYDEHKADYVTPGKRSAQVISAPDEAKAKSLAGKWRGGADWAAMQTAAAAEGAAAIEQDDSTEVGFPDPDLAKAVFAATAADSVSDPVKGVLGWFVVKVTKIIPGTETTLEQVKDALRAKVVAAKAADIMYEGANKVDQLLGNGASFDELPGDLGLAGVSGTLDAQGDTPEGKSAPVPGPSELKAAIVAAAFQAHEGDQPRLTEVQTPSTGGSAYYALVVDSIVPPGAQPFDAVKDRVAADWQQDQRRRVQDAAAAALMVAVQDGKSFSDAATVAGVTPHLGPLVTRNQPSQDVPADLQRLLFGLKKGEATMVETPDGFVVGQLSEIVKPDASADKAGYETARTAVTRSLTNDISSVFIDALRQRAKPQINQQALNSIVQP